MAGFSRAWQDAARVCDVRLAGHLQRLASERRLGCDLITAALVRFRSNSDMRGWAETSLMTGGCLRPVIVERELGLPSGAIEHGPIERYVSLSERPICDAEFRATYPEVAVSLAYRFVLLHELGHVAHGADECCADIYAFEQLGVGRSQIGMLTRQSRNERARNHLRAELRTMSRTPDRTARG